MIRKIGLFLFLSLSLFLIWLIQYTIEYVSNPRIEPVGAVVSYPEKAITLALVGDMMLDRGIARSVDKNFGGDYSKMFENVPEIKQTDITFGNLEGPITKSNDKRGSAFSFKMNPVVASVLGQAGFDVVSFANNHVGDYGQAGFVDTLKYLENSNVLFTGAGMNIEDASTARIVNVRGKKIGFLGFTDVGPDWMKATTDSPGVLLASNPNLENIISTEKSKVDFLVVSFHWGEEYKPTTDRQRKLATEAVSSGADVVVGHHPHVIQEDTVIDGKPVLFSLGNFIFDQTTPEQTKIGMVALITFNIDNTISLDKFSVDRTAQYRPSAIRPFKDSDIITDKKDKEIAYSCPQPKGEATSLRLIGFPRSKPIKGYIPDDLILIPKEYVVTKNVCATQTSYDAFLNMRRDMSKQGLLLLIRYGFRDNDSQESLVASFAERGKSAFVAPVGQSEHILGTAFDFSSGTFAGIFSESKEYNFLKNNAYKYGFVQSFEGDPEDLTKIPNEPWHWRYVGVGVASIIKNSGLPVNLFLNSH